MEIGEAILQFLFFVGFIGSLGAYYWLAKKNVLNLQIFSSSVFVLASILSLMLLGSRNELVGMLSMLLFGVSVFSGGAMLFFTTWRFAKKRKKEN